jgi:hypothetical protein
MAPHLLHGFRSRQEDPQQSAQPDQWAEAPSGLTSVNQQARNHKQFLVGSLASYNLELQALAKIDELAAELRSISQTIEQKVEQVLNPGDTPEPTTDLSSDS